MGEPWNFLLKNSSENLGVHVGFLRFGSVTELLEANTVSHTNLRFVSFSAAARVRPFPILGFPRGRALLGIGAKVLSLCFLQARPGRSHLATCLGRWTGTLF